jgi:hypothetical protein
MDRTCKACGVSNRDDAKFCKSCGSPLPAVKQADIEKEKEHKKNASRFWRTASAIFAAVCVIVFFIYKSADSVRKDSIAREYSSKNIQTDTKTFSGIKPERFLYQGLMWNMTASDIKKIYAYVTDTNDPDFSRSMLITQPQFKDALPNANFMSLGIYEDRLYAVKMEFGDHAVYDSAQLKQPNGEYLMYGRFEGIISVFNQLFGEPSYVQNAGSYLKREQKIRDIKAGTISSGKDAGKPANVYMNWTIGGTKAEVAFFGFNEDLHLTVRFLNISVWDSLQKEQQNTQKQDAKSVKLF